MDTALSNYNLLQGSSKTEAINTLDEGITSIGDMEGSFNDIKDQISGAIIDYSDIIDYGFRYWNCCNYNFIIIALI